MFRGVSYRTPRDHSTQHRFSEFVDHIMRETRRHNSGVEVLETSLFNEKDVASRHTWLVECFVERNQSCDGKPEGRRLDIS